MHSSGLTLYPGPTVPTRLARFRNSMVIRAFPVPSFSLQHVLHYRNLLEGLIEATEKRRGSTMKGQPPPPNRYLNTPRIQSRGMGGLKGKGIACSYGWLGLAANFIHVIREVCTYMVSRALMESFSFPTPRNLVRTWTLSCQPSTTTLDPVPGLPGLWYGVGGRSGRERGTLFLFCQEFK